MASKTKSRGGRSDGYPWDAEMEDKMIELMGIRIHTTDLRGMRDNKVKYEVVWQQLEEWRQQHLPEKPAIEAIKQRFGGLASNEASI
jgi:hypothetical protein